MNRVVSYISILMCCHLLIPQNELMAQQKKISHTFYATGNLGHYGNQSSPWNLKQVLKQAEPNTTFLLLGNSIPPKKRNKVLDEGAMDNVIELTNGFKGNTIAIAGVGEWSYGLAGQKEISSYFHEGFNSKSAFLPNKGCPLDKVKINKDVDLILVDSQWAMADWNKLVGINRDCPIRSKIEFYVELEAEIKKSEGKTVIVAMHHPIYSRGTASKGLNFGINAQKTSNKQYKDFIDRLITMARQTTNVIFLAGHDKSLQYLERKGIPIINSGAPFGTDRVQSVKEGMYASAETGISKIIQYTDGSVTVEFVSLSKDNGTVLFQKQIIPPTLNGNKKGYGSDHPKHVHKSIYSKEEMERTGFYKFLWGEHYRSDYMTKVKMETALLDTLYGGLKPLRKGGGHQTNSLRLVDKNGKEYTMRSARKSALRFAQYFIFKTLYLNPEVGDTFFLKLLQDYWTTANAYGVLTVGDLADAIGVLHPNTRIFYIPKQDALGEYNDAYGDHVYFIEERLTDGLGDVTSLGNHDKVINSLELFEELRKDREDVQIDEALYIRTRLFDNLIGDWDRHADQWKWGEQTINGKKQYRPIPRDRDQVYSDFDGFMLSNITLLTPPLRFMQRYKGDYKHLRWFNDAGDDIDLAVLKQHTKEDWLREARYIKENLTEAVIDRAFENFPPEVDQEKVRSIKRALLERLEKLEANASDRYDLLMSTVLVVGTDKKDEFNIVRLPNGKTKILGYRIKKDGSKVQFWNVAYDKKNTKHIWLYGLDGDDTFYSKGEISQALSIKIIGGNGNDSYMLKNPKRIKVYDHRSAENVIAEKVSKRLSDNYDLNTYYFKKNRRDVTNLIPITSFNPDNGLGLGVAYQYTKKALLQDSFTDRHQLFAQYYFDTRGVEGRYIGTYSDIMGALDLSIELGYTSPKFTNNFFGLGNETLNNDDELGFDFNRVRLQSLRFAPSLVLKGYNGSEFKAGISYENIKVEDNEGRFIRQADVNPKVFTGQNFYSVLASYSYQNFDNDAFARKGIAFGVDAGYTLNFDEGKKIGFVKPQLRLTSKLDRRGLLVLATKARTHFVVGNEFEFYQAATLGDRDGLRGFRMQRFSGKTAFSQSTDLRIPLGNVRNNIIPMSSGMFLGFDYGRVWVKNDTSNKWHTSFGGGAFFSFAGYSSLNMAYFSSNEGGRFVFGLNLPF